MSSLPVPLSPVMSTEVASLSGEGWWRYLDEQVDEALFTPDLGAACEAIAYRDPDTEESEEAAGNESQQNDQTPKVEYNPDLISEILDELEGEYEDVSDPGPNVELYVTSWCTYCHKAKAFFRSKGIEFTEYNIEKDEEAAKRMLSHTKSRAVPFVIINGQTIQGYSIAAYEHALKN